MKPNRFTIRRPVAVVLAAVAAGVALVACSSAPDASPTEATVSTESALTTAGKSPCPSALPRNGSSCTQDQLLCSWGSDTRFGCRQEARCQSGAWQNLTYSCPPREPSCPRSAPHLADGGRTACSATDLGITCTYGDTAYTCAPCIGTLCFAQENLWQTSTLPAGCPAVVPNFGQSCRSPDTVCDYNICADDYNVSWVFGASMKCESGLWTAYAHTICL